MWLLTLPKFIASAPAWLISWKIRSLPLLSSTGGRTEVHKPVCRSKECRFLFHGCLTPKLNLTTDCRWPLTYSLSKSQLGKWQKIYRKYSLPETVTEMSTRKYSSCSFLSEAESIPRPYYVRKE